MGVWKWWTEHFVALLIVVGLVDGECHLKDYGPHPWLVKISNEATKSGVAISTGSLIWPNRILITTSMYNEWKNFTFPLKKGILAVNGYDFETRCSQKQWAKKIWWHFDYVRRRPLNRGRFGLIDTWNHFGFIGAPFLFEGGGAYPNWASVEAVLTRMNTNPEAHVMMYLFKTNSTADSMVLGGNTISYLPFSECQKTANWKKVSPPPSPEITEWTFFCGGWIPEAENFAKYIVSGRHGYATDWYAGAPVIYNDTKTILPIGLYQVFLGKSGEPRVFSTFTDLFVEWMEDPDIPVTLDPPGSEETSEMESTHPGSTLPITGPDEGGSTIFTIPVPHPSKNPNVASCKSISFHLAVPFTFLILLM